MFLRSWTVERKAPLRSLRRERHVSGSKDLRGSDGPRRFTNEKSGDPSGYSRSHTCFNRLDLSLYDDYEGLERKLCSTIWCVVPLFPAHVCLWGRSQGGERIWPGARNYRVNMPAFLHARTRWLGNGFRVRSYQCPFAQPFLLLPFLRYDMISPPIAATVRTESMSACWFRSSSHHAAALYYACNYISRARSRCPRIISIRVNIVMAKQTPVAKH